MLSRTLKQLGKTLGFRLALWYSALFILSSTILFGVAFYLVSSTFRSYDHQILQAKINEYTQIERAEGIPALAARIRFEEDHNLESGVFIRLSDARNRTIVSITPRHWRPSEASLLEGIAGPASGAQWETTVPRERGDALVLIGRRLSDGSILQAAKRPELRGRLLDSFARIFAGILAPVGLIGIAGGWFLSLRALRPIRDLIGTVHSIAGGRMDARVPSRNTGDELDELVRLFNAMLSRIESLINGMREALDNVAHDLRTPITRLRNVIETALQSKAGEAELREALMDTAEEAERINSALGTLMDISEAEKGIMELNWEEADLVALIRQVVELYQLRGGRQGRDARRVAAGRASGPDGFKPHPAGRREPGGQRRQIHPRRRARRNRRHGSRRRGQDHGRRRRDGDPGKGPAPDLRAAVPRGKEPLPSRARSGVEHRAGRGARAPRHGRGPQPPRPRVHLRRLPSEPRRPAPRPGLTRRPAAPGDPGTPESQALQAGIPFLSEM